jgi:hypothetical protein
MPLDRSGQLASDQKKQLTAGLPIKVIDDNQSQSSSSKGECPLSTQSRHGAFLLLALRRDVLSALSQGKDPIKSVILKPREFWIRTVFHMFQNYQIPDRRRAPSAYRKGGLAGPPNSSFLRKQGSVAESDPSLRWDDAS